MKKNILVALLVAGILSVGSVAWSIPVYGDEDLLKGSANIGPSNPLNEADFVNGILGTSFSSGDLVQLSGVSWTLLDSSHGVFELSSKPTWFLVKAGNTHYLYENNDSLDWAYVNFATSGMSTNSQGVYVANGISHYSELDGNAPVPEPATMLLFGAGLVGLAGAARKRSKKK